MEAEAAAVVLAESAPTLEGFRARMEHTGIIFLESSCDWMN